MFEKISNETKKALDEMGFKEPTEVQRETVPRLLAGTNVIVQAKTGSGKTAAYGIPAVDMDIDTLVVTPTRELARQVRVEISKISKYRRKRIAEVFGGVGYDRQIRDVRDADIVIGTPGRLIDLWRKEYLDFERFNFVVLDEADVMLDMGFIDDIEIILTNTTRKLTGFFSATIPPEINRLARKYVRDAEYIKLSKSDTFDVAEIEHKFLKVRDDWPSKVRNVKQAIVPGSIVFTRTKLRTSKLAKILGEDFEVADLHGDLPQSTRNRNIDAFRRGDYDVLVATDVAARGINILSVKKVINFDAPKDEITYLHRVGRTGRMGKGGEAITFVTDEDETLMHRLSRLLGMEIRPVRATV